MWSRGARNSQGRLGDRLCHLGQLSIQSVRHNRGESLDELRRIARLGSFGGPSDKVDSGPRSSSWQGKAALIDVRIAEGVPLLSRPACRQHPLGRESRTRVDPRSQRTVRSSPTVPDRTRPRAPVRRSYSTSRDSTPQRWKAVSTAGRRRATRRRGLSGERLKAIQPTKGPLVACPREPKLDFCMVYTYTMNHNYSR